jgi:hypothetical protein
LLLRDQQHWLDPTAAGTPHQFTVRGINLLHYFKRDAWQVKLKRSV